jgi:hypothetical protein
MNVTSLTSWKSHDVVPNASSRFPLLCRRLHRRRRPICNRVRKWRHNFRIWISRDLSAPSCVSAPRIGLVPPVPHYIYMYDGMNFNNIHIYINDAFGGHLPRFQVHSPDLGMMISVIWWAMLLFKTVKGDAWYFHQYFSSIVSFHFVFVPSSPYWFLYTTRGAISHFITEPEVSDRRRDIWWRLGYNPLVNLSLSIRRVQHGINCPLKN